MKRVIALTLLVLITIISLTRCTSKLYKSGSVDIGWDWQRHYDINAKVEANKFVFDKNDVTLDFYYTLYSLENRTLDDVRESFYRLDSGDNTNWQYVHAIYISKEKNLLFDMNKDNLTLIDYENNVNASLYKFISFEDSFTTDYGYTTVQKGILKTILYNHGEQITIPAKLFDESSNYVYIHLVRLNHNLSNNKYEYYSYREDSIAIKYKLLGDNKVILFGE